MSNRKEKRFKFADDGEYIIYENKNGLGLIMDGKDATNFLRSTVDQVKIAAGKRELINRKKEK